MTITRERVEMPFLVGCCVSICDIFLKVWSLWDEDGDSPRNPLKSSGQVVDRLGVTRGGRSDYPNQVLSCCELVGDWVSVAGCVELAGCVPEVG